MTWREASGSERLYARLLLLAGKVDAVNGDDGDEFPAQRREMLYEVADELRALAQVAAPDHDCTWWSGGVTCALCGFEWIGAWCECADRGALQCPSTLCGAFAGMPEPPSTEDGTR